MLTSDADAFWQKRVKTKELDPIGGVLPMPPGSANAIYVSIYYLYVSIYPHPLKCHTHDKNITLADLGGVPGARPPMGPNSFVFAYIFSKKHPCWRTMPP